MRCFRQPAGIASCLIILGAVLAKAPPTMAEAVDLELVLAVDVSGSVDEVESRLQREGYLRAMVHPVVLRAIQSGERRKIAVTYVEWAGSHYQRVVVDWTIIRDRATAAAFAAKINASPRVVQRWTSISAAIDFAMARLAVNPHRGERRVIDISGDGPNNSGRFLDDARKEALAKGVTINGLPIVNNRPNPWGMPSPRNLDKYYARNVIGGPGAFIIVARGFRAFADAIRHKLVREIAGRTLAPRLTQRAELPSSPLQPHFVFK